MQISNLNNFQTNSFKGALHRGPQQNLKINNLESAKNPYVVYSCSKTNDNDYVASDSFEPIESDFEFKNDTTQNSKLRSFLSLVLTSLAIGGAIGYTTGEEKGKEAGYTEGYNAGIEYAQSLQEEPQRVSPFSEDFVITEEYHDPSEKYVYTPDEVTTEVQLTGIPENIQSLAGNNSNITEIDFTKEVILYNSEAKLPSWLVNTKADREVVRQAQYNLARVFQNGNEIYIYLKQDTTMGDIKGVYGILDGVLGNYPENKMTTRPKIGNTGNYDNAIVKAGEIIKLEKVTTKEGNTIFRYAAHESDKSHQKTIAIIQKYADDKFSYSK